MVPLYALILLIALLLPAGCSSDRKAPAPLPPPMTSPAGNVVTPTAQQGGGPLVGGEPTRAPGAVGRNSPPVIRSVRFIHADVNAGTGLGVEVESYDADGDAVQFEIAWTKNGDPAGSGSRLTTPLKRGDKVTVTVIPFDGKERGKTSTLFREILNTAPVIEGQEQFQVSDNDVIFHVRASDADGDPLVYSLKDAPAGMGIDRKTGWVRWMTSPGTTGKVPFTVIVSDGAGGETTARFTVTVAEQPSPAAR
jgi:Putative Ig domain